MATSMYRVYADGVHLGTVTTKWEARNLAGAMRRGDTISVRITRDGDDWERWRKSPDGDGRRWYKAVP